MRREKKGGVRPIQVDVELERAKVLLSKLDSLLASEGSAHWLFGQAQPTALDAHTVVSLIRLQDVGMGTLIPSALEQYAAMAMRTSEWQSVFKGTHTMITL